MILACPHCGSGACVRNGGDDLTVDYLDDGRVARRRTWVTRVKCRSCGKSGRAYDPADVATEAGVRAHVVERVFALGREGASAETGVPTTTLQRHMQAWAESREADVRDAVPDLLHLERVRLRQADALLVVDMDRHTLVEVLDGTAELAGWLTAPGRTAAVEACVPLDPAVVAAMRAHAPPTRLLAAPSAVAKAVRGAALLSVRALRRRPEMAGRNGMPTVPEFAACLDGAPSHGGWPAAASALLAVARLSLAVSQCPTREAAERLWPELALAGADGAGRAVSALMATWREPLLAGLGRRDVEAAAGLSGRLRHGLATRRPALGFPDLRAYAVLRGFERRTEGPYFPGGPAVDTAAGTDLHTLLARLAA